MKKCLSAFCLSFLLGSCIHTPDISFNDLYPQPNPTAQKEGFINIRGTYGGTFESPPGSLSVATAYGPNHEGKVAIFHVLTLFSKESINIGLGVGIDGSSSTRTYVFGPKGYKHIPGERLPNFRDQGTARYLDVSFGVRSAPIRMMHKSDGFELKDGNMFLLKHDSDLEVSQFCQIPVNVRTTPTVTKLLPFYKEFFPDDSDIQELEYPNEHLSGPSLPLEEKLKIQAEPEYLLSALNCSPQNFEVTF